MSFVSLEQGRTTTRVRVTGVIDGDTLDIDRQTVEFADVTQVRLIGVDTPEIEPLDRAKDAAVWCAPPSQVWQMAGQATDALDSWLGQPRSSRPVDVVAEVIERQIVDDVGRLLAYVYRDMYAGGVTESASGEVLRRGLSRAFVREYGAVEDFPNITIDDKRVLRQQEHVAEQENRGFWRRTPPFCTGRQ